MACQWSGISIWDGAYLSLSLSDWVGGYFRDKGSGLRERMCWLMEDGTAVV